MNVRPVDKLPSRLGKMPGLLLRLLSNACTTGACVSYQTAPTAPTFEQAQASEHDSRLLETLKFPGQQSIRPGQQAVHGPVSVFGD